MRRAARCWRRRARASDIVRAVGGVGELPSGGRRGQGHGRKGCRWGLKVKSREEVRGSVYGDICKLAFPEDGMDEVLVAR